jgi:hypothetical protein
MIAVIEAYQVRWPKIARGLECRFDVVVVVVVVVVMLAMAMTAVDSRRQSVAVALR